MLFYSRGETKDRKSDYQSKSKNVEKDDFVFATILNSGSNKLRKPS